jgi:hypothetical protein
MFLTFFGLASAASTLRFKSVKRITTFIADFISWSGTSIVLLGFWQMNSSNGPTNLDTLDGWWRWLFPALSYYSVRVRIICAHNEQNEEAQFFYLERTLLISTYISALIAVAAAALSHNPKGFNQGQSLWVFTSWFDFAVFVTTLICCGFFGWLVGRIYEYRDMMEAING